ncbi:uncharacterized protein At2g39795, mitochondrial-like [Rutidosis leptorrhynchoides]|uniref:uncharacterized protein At2g39795, mitochondrial-like n=1 Tax=Rutidosis leptorrhynchoides TaxID=125765 RepID=UPI003A998428
MVLRLLERLGRIKPKVLLHKSDLDNRVRRLIRHDIRYELDTYPLPQFVPKFKSFAVEERPGENWIRLNTKFGDKEEIKVEATMVPVTDSPPKDCDITTDEYPKPYAYDEPPYLKMVINIIKGEENGILGFVCNVWPDLEPWSDFKQPWHERLGSDCVNEVEIDKVYMDHQVGYSGFTYDSGLGAEFDDLDDELKTQLKGYLERRGINNGLALFLTKCMDQKSKNEYTRWIKSLESFVARQSN